MDQADTLRRLMQFHGKKITPAPRLRQPVYVFSSGKGGVGKSVCVSHLGAQLARQGLRVLLVDGDFGLANLDILLNIQPVATFEEVVSGQASMKEALIGVEPNLWLLPSGSGWLEARAWAPDFREKLVGLFEACPWEMDVILVDSGAGIHESVLSLHQHEVNSVVLLTPEPTAFADAYGLIKTLNRVKEIRDFKIVVNQVASEAEGEEIFNKFQGVCRKFLEVNLQFFGSICRDEKVTQAVMKRKILLDLDMRASAVQGLERISRRLIGHIGQGQTNEADGRIQFRFKDEPAQSAPWITQGLPVSDVMRSLLG
ncbi:MAG: P-loop NTPase [Bdellovibrionales bacterium]|nr:P-loop NTPase [Bdellovibrionales bacterium]